MRRTLLVLRAGWAGLAAHRERQHDQCSDSSLHPPATHGSQRLASSRPLLLPRGVASATPTCFAASTLRHLRGTLLPGGKADVKAPHTLQDLKRRAERTIWQVRADVVWWKELEDAVRCTDCRIDHRLSGARHAHRSRAWPATPLAAPPVHTEAGPSAAAPASLHLQTGCSASVCITATERPGDVVHVHHQCGESQLLPAPLPPHHHGAQSGTLLCCLCRNVQPSPWPCGGGCSSCRLNCSHSGRAGAMPLPAGATQVLMPPPTRAANGGGVQSPFHAK